MIISYCVCAIYDTEMSTPYAARDWGVFALHSDGKLQVVRRYFRTEQEALWEAKLHIRGWVEEDARQGHSV